MLKEFGDFQTPEPLVDLVIACLAQTGSRWERVLEPTCGTGNFIRGVLDSSIFSPNGEVQGIEIQTSHFRQAVEIKENNLRPGNINLINASIFNLNLKTDLQWRSKGNLLVIGNPPWVTNAQLGALESGNLPEKRNLKRLSGFDALTGGSNFDIAEYIWLKLIWELVEEKPTIALLCKTSVARNILQFAAKSSLPILNAYIRKIDAKKWFNAHVDACLFVAQIGASVQAIIVPVYSDLTTHTPEQRIGIIDGNIVANIEAYQESAALDGKFPLSWRQGIKHDAADVMELSQLANGTLQNKLGENVDIEANYVFPLLKSSDLFNMRFSSNRLVIVTQRYVGQKTADLQIKAPLLWNYLQQHRPFFERRKSSIYVGKPSFSMFGVGDYTFSEYKVAISGLYKTPRFIPIGPINNRPVIFDDTCYFIRCESALQCAVISILLNSSICQKFLLATSFVDAKRPITKKLLQRINLRALWDQADISEVWEEARNLVVKLSLNGIVPKTKNQPVNLEDIVFFNVDAEELMIQSRLFD